MSVNGVVSAPDSWLGLQGRKAVVVGAGGIGAAVVRSLSSAGADVAVVDRSLERLECLAAASGDGGKIATIAADLSTADESRRAVREATSVLGGLDIFVHAVGQNNRRPIFELGDDDWDRLVRTNLSTAFWTGQEAGRLISDSGGGRLVFISSVSGLLAHADHSIYAATKGGLNQLIRVMAREWAINGVEVNAVAPGYVETDLTRAHLDHSDVRERLVGQVPAGRLGSPEEVAHAVTFLASPKSGFITGQILYVDGGRTLV